MTTHAKEQKNMGHVQTKTKSLRTTLEMAQLLHVAAVINMVKDFEETMCPMNE